MGILVAKRILCEDGTCGVHKVGTCIDLRPDINGNETRVYMPMPSICPTGAEKTEACTNNAIPVGNAEIVDMAKKDQEFGKKAFEVLKAVNDQVAGSDYECKGQAAGAVFSYADLATKTIALK
jgi:hypothetical protein